MATYILTLDLLNQQIEKIQQLPYNPDVKNETENIITEMKKKDYIY